MVYMNHRAAAKQKCTNFVYSGVRGVYITVLQVIVISGAIGEVWVIIMTEHLSVV